MPKVKATSGCWVNVTTSQALQIRRLRRKYEAEFILSVSGATGLIGTVYGREVFILNHGFSAFPCSVEQDIFKA